jgi:hypothetical protein
MTILTRTKGIINRMVLVEHYFNQKLLLLSNNIVSSGDDFVVG